MSTLEERVSKLEAGHFGCFATIALWISLTGAIGFLSWALLSGTDSRRGFDARIATLEAAQSRPVQECPQ